MTKSTMCGLGAGVLPILAIVAAGCGNGRPTGRGNPDGSVVDGPDAAQRQDGGPLVDCTERARWVYVVDSDDLLMRFQPDTLSFTPVGTLACAADGSSPFSMSVDRDATAWVLYQNGRIYHVSTLDAACSPTAFEPSQLGFEVFGMGFVADVEGGSAESLFVAGGSSASIASGSSTLGRIDTTTLRVSGVGSLPGWPELTGTGNAALWAFMPDTVPPSVRRLDKSNAASLDVFDLDALGTVRPSAWAFAFWGGRFYVFLQAATDTSTNVWRLDGDGSAFTEALHDTGYRIVGAGVSTCAPVELI